MRNETAWRRDELVDRPVLRRHSGGVHMMFFLGPRWADRSHEERSARLLGALEPEVEALRWCHQVHGRLLASLSGGDEHRLSGAAGVGRCDGLITADPGVGLVVWTADCVPVLLHGGGVVAAVHAGWRGVVAGIVPSAVRRFELEYGVAPSELNVVLGPSVGPCHYEVGQEVVDALTSVDPGRYPWRRGNRVDLRALIMSQAASAGVEHSAVERVGGCTACDAEMASYRRDGERAGRQVSLVVLSGGGGLEAG